MKLNTLYKALIAAWGLLGVQGGIIRVGTEANGNMPAEQPIESMSMKPYSITAALTLTEKVHAGRLGVFDIAAGVAVTLPRATGTGAVYAFFVKTTVTSLNDVIQVANADDVIQGNLAVASDNAADAAITFKAASTSDTITLNGTTKGGYRGDYIEIQDVANGVFSVRGLLAGTGTEVTPFSAAV